MPFCYSPWTNVDISPTGYISPCCKFQIRHYTQKFNIQNQTLTEYSDSNLIKQIKQEFVNGQWPAGCERCRIEEENNIASKRQLDHIRWKELYNNYNLQDKEFITASIAFGNTCNLACITCAPHSSSRWQKEHREIYNVDVQPFHFYKKNFVEDFAKSARHIVHIDIPGGEPFLSGVKEQKELLEHYINIGQAQHMTLHYTTNATVFPDSRWWELWQHFQEIDLQISLDGVGNRAEYIRFPCNWNEVTEHVTRYIDKEKLISNFRLSVSHTVSAFNIFYLNEFFDWIQTIKLPRPWLGRVHTPFHLRPSVWPSTAKDFIIDKLSTSKYADVQQWATLINNSDDSKYFDQFKQYVQTHDTYRKLSFSNTFPEITKFIDER
jgi:hypothetical protein